MTSLIEIAYEAAYDAAYEVATNSASEASGGPAEIATVAAQASQRVAEKLQEATMLGNADAIDSMLPVINASVRG